ncbi:hypothetical protein [Neobacillus paridis]|uniref:hypothetical protein n=1 Tax=Neobacillus paridis TaxID=2803862 RepID=UPI00192C5E36|nr:hypothetical protein [Neobacillus paridis]
MNIASMQKYKHTKQYQYYYGLKMASNSSMTDAMSYQSQPKQTNTYDIRKAMIKGYMELLSNYKGE